MKLHRESHLDHSLDQAQTNYVCRQFEGRTGFFIETIELPVHFGTVPCALYGPLMGDAPVTDDQVTLERRGDRKYRSRMIAKPARRTSKVTVIAGPHTETCPRCEGSGVWYGLSIPPDNGPHACTDCVDGKVTHACILYTAFGGPLAPQEPGDIRRQLEAVELERRERDKKDGDPASAGMVDVPWDAQEATRAKLDPIYAKIVALRAKRAESDAFWRDHALAK